MWDMQVLPIVRSAPELWPDASLDTFLCACAAVRTRGFFDLGDGGGGPYLLPAIDLLNHSRANTSTSLVVERGGSSSEGSSVGKEKLIFSMVAERDIGGGEEVTHAYDDLDNTSLLLTYGFVASAGEAPLTATARVPLSMLLDACKAVRDTRHADPFGPPWELREAWSAKQDACKRLLSIYGDEVAVSVQEPLPDVLLTVVQLMLMPVDDFEELIASEERPPLLDGSALDDEPEFAALVTDALLRALDAAIARYADAQSEHRSESSRAQAASLLRAGELEALRATQRSAVRLLGASREEAEVDEDDELSELGVQGEESEESEGEEEGVGHCDRDVTALSARAAGSTHVTLGASKDGTCEIHQTIGTVWKGTDRCAKRKRSHTD